MVVGVDVVVVVDVVVPVARTLAGLTVVLVVEVGGGGP